MKRYGDSRETYMSVDIEADGPAPGLFSMLSIGCVSMRRVHGVVTILDRFYATLQPLPEARQDPETMDFWAKYPDAYEASTKDARPPSEVMAEFHQWAKLQPGNLVFVAGPASFDFMFVSYYLHRFLGENPFGWSALDLHTLAWTKVRGGFRRSQTRQLPAQWKSSEHVHDHHALHDAQKQADIFAGILQGMECSIEKQNEMRELVRSLNKLI